MAKRKLVKKKAKKKSLKQHAKELHAVGKKYTKNALKISVLHRRESAQKEIKKQVAKLEESLKKIVKLAGRM